MLGQSFTSDKHCSAAPVCPCVEPFIRQHAAMLAALELMLENAELDTLNEDVPGIEQARDATREARGEAVQG